MLLTKYLKPIKQKLIEPEEDRPLVIVKNLLYCLDCHIRQEIFNKDIEI